MGKEMRKCQSQKRTFLIIDGNTVIRAGIKTFKEAVNIMRGLTAYKSKYNSHYYYIVQEVLNEEEI